MAAVGDLPLERGDTKGDLYEYLLSKLTTAGINGQFRTPRHIIRLMVELMEPQPTDRICDPSAIRMRDGTSRGANQQEVSFRRAVRLVFKDPSSLEEVCARWVPWAVLG